MTWMEAEPGPLRRDEVDASSGAGKGKRRKFRKGSGTGGEGGCARRRTGAGARGEFGFAANAGAFLGASGAIMTDPTVLFSMAFGAPWATGLLRAAVIKAGGAGAGEALALLVNPDLKERRETCAIRGGGLRGLDAPQLSHSCKDRVCSCNSARPDY